MWFYGTIWPKLKTTIKGITLTVIGRNGHDNAYAPLKIDSQINFIGEVMDVSPFYHKNNIAIVPLLEGSGTRLKILEAMSFGLPVISTSIGADGINYILNKNIVIANTLEEFEKGIKLLTSNKHLSKTISEKAHQLINNKYQWSVIVGKMYKSFKVS